MSLADLESKYLQVTAQAPAIYRGNTVVTVLVHGATYFPVIDRWIKKTIAGDSVFIVGWQFDPFLDLTSGKLGTSNAIGNVLAQQAAIGVDVRIILNGTATLYWLKQLPFNFNLIAAERLRTWGASGSSAPSLAGRVLFDWSGGNLTGSHHQKATFIRAGTELVAFVGGMDMVKDHWDSVPHPATTWPDGSPWGWHDCGVQLLGEAAKGVWANFCHRWQEVRTLPEKHYTLHHVDGSVSSGLFNPNSPADPPPPDAPPNPDPAAVAPPPDLADPPPAASADSQSVQIIRSRYRWKIPYLFGGGTEWAEGPIGGGTEWTKELKGGLYEVHDVLKKAILAATQYIYIEDQFLDETPNPEEVFSEGLPWTYLQYSLFGEIQKALQLNNELRVIFVGSGKSDPIDLFPGSRNQTVSQGIKTLYENLPLLTPQVAVWRVTNVTVHTKLMIIDDEFAAIGSANFHSRSMFGTDEELHTAIVAVDDAQGNNTVRQLRYNLWAEHWRMTTNELQAPAVMDAFKDVKKAVGLWNSKWSADSTMWRSNSPAGFQWPRPPRPYDEQSSDGQKNKYGGIAPVGPEGLS